EEIDRIIAAACNRPWLADIVTVGLYTGLRQGELLALDMEYLDFTKKEITVVGTLGRDGRVGTPKNGKVRVVPMLPQAEAVLRELRGIWGPVLRNSLGERRAIKDVSRAFTEAHRKAGIEGGGDFHTLRHSFCSRLANNGTEITTVSRILGHS